MSETTLEDLVDVAWIREHLSDPDVRILDVRQLDPRIPFNYQTGHIPGALPLDLRYLVAGGRPGALPPTEHVATVLAQLGLRPESTIVVYDDGIGPTAGMSYWALKHYGHHAVRVLNGGWVAWEEAGGETSTTEPSITPTTYAINLDPDQRATIDWVLSNLNNDNIVLLDCRTRAEYIQGHLPKAVNLSWDAAVQPGRVMRLKDAATLKAQFEQLGVTTDKEIVTYCGSGARSSHTYMTLKMLGHRKVCNYNGSWQEWAMRPDTPKEV
ncbi:MAG: sulfurtransferase [Bacteroidota bacterium]